MKFSSKLKQYFKLAVGYGKELSAKIRIRIGIQSIQLIEKHIGHNFIPPVMSGTAAISV